MSRVYFIALALLLANPFYNIIAEDNQSRQSQKQAPHEKKIEEYRQKLADNPNDIELHRAYQNLMRQWGGLNDLKEEYLLKLNAEPHNPLYFYLYGRLTEGKELEDSFKRAIDLETKTSNPELRFWLYFGFGQFYLDSKKYKEALNHLETAAKLKPDSLDVQHQMALVYYEMDNIAEAMNLWDKILQAKNDHPEAMLGKALIYKSRGMYDNATKELENILKVDVAFWRAYEPLIQCYHAKLNYKRGAELSARIKEIYLKQLEYNINLGYLELITIDIIHLKPKVIIIKERITPAPQPGESRFNYADYCFEIYKEGIYKKPSYIYELYGPDEYRKKQDKNIFRLNKVIGDIGSNQAKRETIKEYTSMPSYHDLLNDVLEKELKK
ncbi:MAG TPA: tetratricopeptide repeat protein [Planctomycetota bacterium]|nr:tetratricopeptide repeat protein [Planctomycetota bacterium]